MSPIDWPYQSLVAQPVVVVGVAAGQLSATDKPARAIMVQADPFNTGTIYLGDTSGVTNAPALAHTALRAGDWRSLPLNNLTDLWAVSTVAAQKLLVSVAVA